MYASFKKSSQPTVSAVPKKPTVSQASNPTRHAPLRPSMPSVAEAVGSAKFTASRGPEGHTMSGGASSSHSAWQSNQQAFSHLFPPSGRSPSGAYGIGNDEDWFAKNASSSCTPLENQMSELLHHLVIGKAEPQNRAEMKKRAEHPPSVLNIPSPVKKQRVRRDMTPCSCHDEVSSEMLDPDQVCIANDKPSSFSMKIDEDTFASRPPNLTSRSTDSINSKFTAEDWHGRFAGDHFQPSQDGVPGHPRRAQSGTRARHRSPTKVRPDAFSTGQEVPTTPGGSLFSAQHWAESFKPQTFAPPPSAAAPLRPLRKPRGPSARAPTGAAAVVEDDDSSDAKVQGEKVESPIPSPDAMDIDPPATPQGNQQMNDFHVNMKGPAKRPAAPTPSATDDELKIHMDDLQIKDILSTLNLPKYPRPPVLPRRRRAAPAGPPRSGPARRSSPRAPRRPRPSARRRTGSPRHPRPRPHDP